MHVIQVWNIVVWQWFALQTYVTLVSIVMCHALDFISTTFRIEELLLQFGLSISWPSFEMPEISATYFLGIGILFLTLLRSYATQLLAWCSGQTWFAMPEASPGMWEERAMTAFSYSRYVQG